MQHALASRAWVRGVSLIEVLVTVVVVSIGLLGLAGLQASGTKFNHSAYMRSQATNLAYDMADRMRANLAGDYTVVAFENTYSVATGPACSVALGAVTVARDANQWKSCLETALPVGRGRVAQLAGGGAAYADACGVDHPAADIDLFVIEVTWDNSRLQNEDTDECVVVRTEVAPL